MRRIKIFIIAGHSVGAPGAIAWNGRTEHSYNVELQQMVAGLLTSKELIPGLDIQVVTDDETKPLSEVIRWIELDPAEHKHVLDIHFNFDHPTARGCEIFIHPNTSDWNRQMAVRMINSISQELGTTIRRADPGRDYKFPSESAVQSLAILRGKFPAILVEPEFLSKRGLALYEPKKWQVANAIAHAYVINYSTGLLA
jgi:N-acetylmuramoyl-L-alanine amidase